jgi:hypothetical protein
VRERRETGREDGSIGKDAGGEGGRQDGRKMQCRRKGGRGECVHEGRTTDINMKQGGTVGRNPNHTTV